VQEIRSVWRLALAFIDIALHRRGPEELPASQFLMGMALVLDVSVGLLSLWVLGMFQTDALLLFLDCAFFLAYVFVTLRLFRHERRFAQTTSALLGTDVLFNLIGLPLALWGRAAAVPPESVTAPTLLRLLLLLWWVDVSGFVLGRAIGRPYFVGVLFVILYVMASLSIRDLLAPAAS
jgi:hypothetical protein